MKVKREVRCKKCNKKQKAKEHYEDVDIYSRTCPFCGGVCEVNVVPVPAPIEVATVTPLPGTLYIIPRDNGLPEELGRVESIIAYPKIPRKGEK